MNRKSFLSSLSGVAAACALQCFGVSTPKLKPPVPKFFLDDEWQSVNGAIVGIDPAFTHGEYIVRVTVHPPSPEMAPVYELYNKKFTSKQIVL